MTDRYFKAVRTSCACGGSTAWVEIKSGVEVMHGCICHTTLPPDAIVLGENQ